MTGDGSGLEGARASRQLGYSQRRYPTQSDHVSEFPDVSLLSFALVQLSRRRIPCRPGTARCRPDGLVGVVHAVFFYTSGDGLSGGGVATTEGTRLSSRMLRSLLHRHTDTLLLPHRCSEGECLTPSPPARGSSRTSKDCAVRVTVRSAAQRSGFSSGFSAIGAPLDVFPGKEQNRGRAHS